MATWKPQGPTCKDCLSTLEERSVLATCGKMITPNGHGTPLKNPQNFTTGCNGNLLIKNGHPKAHIIKAHINNGNSKNGSLLEKNGHHLDLVKDTLCCFKQQSQSSLKKPSDEDYEMEDYSCGLWSLKPQWLQPFANKKVFLAVFCLASVLQGMYYTYFVSMLTTIEKLYQIQSKLTGVIMSATEIGQIGGALLLTYFGGHGHRPKWIACGMFVFAIASIFCATPHFLYSDKTNPISSNAENSTVIALKELKTKLCHNKFVSSDSSRTLTYLPSNISTDGAFTKNSSDSETNYNRPKRSANSDLHNEISLLQSLPSPWTMQQGECTDQSKVETFSYTKNVVLIIFFISLLFIGIGATAVYTLGIPYIDDNVATRESPLYFGITIGVRIFGPVFGFLLGSFCTSIYVNFPFETADITTDNPQWLGAWWLGVLIVGAALILTTFPMLSFPKELRKRCKHRSRSPSKKVPQNNSKGELLKNNGNMEGADRYICQQCRKSGFYANRNKNVPKPSLRGLPAAISKLLRNDILVFRIASSVLHILPIAGLYTFMPKYLESQFQQTATVANMITGMAGILVMGIGIFSSGHILRTFKPSARTVAGWIAVSALLYAVGMVILMGFGCPPNKYVGLNAGSEYEGTTQKTCNDTCNCKPGEFSPVCTSEGITYLSPCLAGCSKVSGSSYDKYVYEDCDCLGPNVTAINGLCPLNCGNNLLYYIIIFAIFVIVHSTSEVGSMLLTLRCVEPKDKAMALGLITFAIGLFGNVPCPIIYGAVVDSACLFWEDNCGKSGACRLYDPSKFRYVFHGVTAVLMFFAFFVDLIVWYKAKKIQFQDSDDADDPEEAVPINEVQTETDNQGESSV